MNPRASICVALWSLCSILPCLAQGGEDDLPDPAILYEDESWIHVGDDNFSPDSDAASDLAYKSAGNSLEVKVFLLEDAATRLALPAWKSVEFRGTAIGNDTGKMGQCTSSEVELGDRKIGEIIESGDFVFRIDKSWLSEGAENPNVFRITTGTNGENDRDDQEMGHFQLRLSKEPIAVAEHPDGED